MTERRRRLGRRIAIVLVTAGIAAGCSGDGGGPLTKGEYLEAGDAVCQAAINAFAAFSASGEGDDAVSFTQGAIAVNEKFLDDFEDLEPPPDAALVHGAVIDSLEGSLREQRRALEAAEAGDLDGAAVATGAAGAARRTRNGAARAYGFAVCGSESIPADEAGTVRQARIDRFCDAFHVVVTNEALPPEQLTPLLNRLLASSQPGTRVTVERWSELTASVNRKIFESDGSPLDDLTRDERAFVIANSQLAESGELPAGVVGDMVGTIRQLCRD